MLFLVGAIALTQVLIFSFLVYMFLKVRSLSWDIADRVHQYEEKLHQYEELLAGLFKPQDGKPSKLVEFIEAMSAMLSARLVSSAEAALRGSAGGAARAEHIAERAANPLGAMLSGRLGKNPMMGMILQTVLSKFAPQGDPGSAIVPSNGGSPKFRL